MKRILIAAVMATAASYGATAQDAAQQPDPNAPAQAQPDTSAPPDASTAAPAARSDPGAAHPPESSMEQATPTMKAPDTEGQHPPTERMGEAVPPMKANDPATTQAESTTSSSSAELKVTAEEAKSWIGRTVYSSDGKNLGEVGELVRGPDDKLTEVHADIGGFLGIGETRVRLGSDKIQEVRDDRIILNLKEEEAKALPAVGESASEAK